MTVKLHHLRPAPGARTEKTRVGRGEGSKGKTAGRGTKGTKARKNVPVQGHLSGGQPGPARAALPGRRPDRPGRAGRGRRGARRRAGQGAGRRRPRRCLAPDLGERLQRVGEGEDRQRRWFRYRALSDDRRRRRRGPTRENRALPAAARSLAVGAGGPYRLRSGMGLRARSAADTKLRPRLLESHSSQLVTQARHTPKRSTGPPGPRPRPCAGGTVALRLCQCVPHA
jgi:hypothetical protein